ncbi:MAG: MFS transporter, partial [Bacteroidota bacterium]
MKEIGGFTVQFWLLCVSSFLFFSSFNMMVPELPDYLTSLGGAEYKGYIISLFTLSAAISRPFSGRLADTVGRIPVMVFGAGVCFILGFLYPVVGTVFGFLLLRFFHGFSTGFKPTGTSAYVADIVPDNRRGEAMGMLGVFGSLGIAAGPAIGGFVANNFSTDIMFYTSSAFAILSIIILLGMTETVTVKHQFKLSMLIIPFNEVFEPKVIAPSIVMLLTAYSFGVVLTIIPDYSVYLGVLNKGLFFASITASSIVARLVAGKVSDVYGRIPVLRVSTLLIMFSMWYVGIAPNPTHFFIAGALLGVATGMNSPTIFAWTIDL